MKLCTEEYLALGAVVIYIAFFTHPPPLFVSTIFLNPLGHVAALAGVLFVASKSQIVGLFVAIAYLLSTNSTLEYFDTPAKKEEKQPEQPKASMVSPEVVKGIVGNMLGKAGKIPSVAGKSVTAPPPSTANTTPAPPKKEYTPVK
jgi:hypothetical protein